MSLRARVMAAGHDAVIGRLERAGLTERRAALLAEARGRVLEIGAGTGLSLDRYRPEAIEELVLLEPDRALATRLEARAAAWPGRATVVHGFGEDLPFEDASFDAAALQLVLCSVRDPDAVLAEVARVLRPGGALLFVEHVRAPEGTRRARVQDAIAPGWSVLAQGCRCDRRTEDALARSPLAVERLDRGPLSGAPPWVRPSIEGRAVRPASASLVAPRAGAR